MIESSGIHPSELVLVGSYTFESSFSEVSLPNIIDEKFEVDGGGCEFVPGSLVSFLAEAKTTLEKTQESLRELLHHQQNHQQNHPSETRLTNTSYSADSYPNETSDDDDDTAALVTMEEDEEDLELKKEILDKFGGPNSLFHPYPLSKQSLPEDHHQRDGETSETSSSTSDDESYYMFVMKRDISVGSFQEEEEEAVTFSRDESESSHQSSAGSSSVEIESVDNVPEEPLDSDNINDIKASSTSSNENDFLELNQDILERFQENDKKEGDPSCQKDGSIASNCATVDFGIIEKMPVLSTSFDKRIEDELEKAASQIAEDAKELQDLEAKLCMVSKEMQDGSPSKVDREADSPVCSEENQMIQARRDPTSETQAQSVKTEKGFLPSQNQNESVQPALIETVTMIRGWWKETSGCILQEDEASDLQDGLSTLQVGDKDEETISKAVEYHNTAGNNEKRGISPVGATTKTYKERDPDSNTKSLGNIKEQAKSVMEANREAIGLSDEEMSTSPPPEDLPSPPLDTLKKKIQLVLDANNEALSMSSDDTRSPTLSPLKGTPFANNRKGKGVSEENEKPQSYDGTTTHAMTSLVTGHSRDVERQKGAGKHLKSKAHGRENTLNASRQRDCSFKEDNQTAKTQNTSATTRTHDTHKLSPALRNRGSVEPTKASSQKLVVGSVTPNWRVRTSVRDKENNFPHATSSSQRMKIEQARARARKRIHEFKMRQLQQEKSANAESERSTITSSLYFQEVTGKRETVKAKEYSQPPQKLQNRVALSSPTENHSKHDMTAKDRIERMRSRSKPADTLSILRKRRSEQQKLTIDGHDAMVMGQVKKQVQMLVLKRAREVTEAARFRESCRSTKPITSNREPTSRQKRSYPDRQKRSEENKLSSGGGFRARAVPRSTYVCAHPPKPQKKSTSTNSTVVSNPVPLSKSSESFVIPKRHSHARKIRRPPLGRNSSMVTKGGYDEQLYFGVAQ